MPPNTTTPKPTYLPSEEQREAWQDLAHSIQVLRDRIEDHRKPGWHLKAKAWSRNLAELATLASDIYVHYVWTSRLHGNETPSRVPPPGKREVPQ